MNFSNESHQSHFQIVFDLVRIVIMFKKSQRIKMLIYDFSVKDMEQNGPRLKAHLHLWKTILNKTWKW